MIDLQLAIEKLPQYPLSAIRADFIACLGQSSVLLEAEPGAGKSTLCPLWVLAQQSSDKQVILVQPRILAAQSLAQRLADLIHDPLGQTVGYQVAYHSCFTAKTRLLVVTPGVLVQKLLADSELETIGAVILDEIHERALQQDMLWAFLGELKVLREDLQLVLMSATPDAQLKARTQQVFNAKEIFVSGRCFPVQTTYLPAEVETKNNFKQTENIDRHLIRALNNIVNWQEKTILVFLPGWFEIERCANAILEFFPQHPVYRLHSRVPSNEQRKALDAGIGPRIILSTNIAETSLTIEDVNCVIDSGLANKVDFEQRTGLSRLKKSRISQASAEQRRGRAGRIQAGNCVRLWAQDQHLVPADLPEIRNTDLLALALNLRLWGAHYQSLSWIEPPNLLAMAAAERQLQSMGLLNNHLQVTELAKKIPSLGTHPRVGTFLLLQKQNNSLTHFDWLIALALHFETTTNLKEQNIEVILRSFSLEYSRNSQWQQQLRRWRHQLTPTEKNQSADEFGALVEKKYIISSSTRQSLAIAYQERIGYLQTSGRYKLNSGMSLIGTLFSGRVQLKNSEQNENQEQEKKPAEWAVFPWIGDTGNDFRGIENQGIGFELELDEKQKRQLSQVVENLIYKNNAWQAQTEWRMGGCLIDQKIRPMTTDELESRLIPYLKNIANQQGLSTILSNTALTLLERARIATRLQLIESTSLSPLLDATVGASNRHLAENYLTETYLIERVDLWLLPFLRTELNLDQLPWLQALEYYLGFENCETIRQLLPTELSLPSGRLASVNYVTEENGSFSAEISGKLQEFFGSKGISIAHGKIPLKIHLLSPNGSPLAITQDLTSFWINTYPEVRKEMRGKYPRHPWPDNPGEHLATALTKRALERKALNNKNDLTK